MVRPKPEPGKWAGLTLGDVTLSNMSDAREHKLGKFVSWEASSSLHAPLEGCFVAAGPPRQALLGPGMDEPVQPIRPPGPVDARGVARPKPRQGRGAGLTLGDVTPGNMAAARVPRLGQVRLLISNQQSSRPL